MFVKQNECKVKDAVIYSPTSETYSKQRKLNFPLKIVAMSTIEGFLSSVLQVPILEDGWAEIGRRTGIETQS